MPEGHSILRAAQLWETLKGEPLAISSPQGRFSKEASLINGMTLLRAEAHGKHLFLHFSRDRIVHIHLALYGKHYLFPSPAPAPRATVRLRISGAKETIDLIGPAICELLTHEEYLRVMSRLGSDPLKLELMPEALLTKLKRSTRPVGQILMDQTLIAGIGNVYRAETLFFEGQSPFSEAKSLDENHWQSLWSRARKLLISGVPLAKGTYTFIPTLELPRSVKVPPPPPTTERFCYVYGATGLPCLGCGTPVEAQEFHGRTLYFCPICQR